MRGVAVAVILVLAAGAAGVYLLWPRGGGIQFAYVISFPPGFAGDRKAAAEEAARVLQGRVSVRCISSGATAYADGRILLRLANVTEDRVPELRAILEKRGEFRVKEADQPIVGSEDVLSAMADPPEGKQPTLTFQLSREAADRVRRAAKNQTKLAVAFDDAVVFHGVPHVPTPADEFFFPVSMADAEAQAWGAVFQGGRLPHPIGEPKVERYRGRGLRP